MSFLRRNQDDSQGGTPNPPPPPSPGDPPMPGSPPANLEANATATPPPPERQKKDEQSNGGGIIQYLRDTYNGLYKITLAPSMPKISTIVLLIVGFTLGLVWGYLLSPPIFAGANPYRLNDAAQEQWVRMVAVGYAADQRYELDDAIELLDRVDNPQARINNLIGTLDPNQASADIAALQTLNQALQTQNATVTGEAAPQPPSLVDEVLNVLLPVILIIIITPILFLLWRLIIEPGVVQPIRKQIRIRNDPEFRKKQEELAQQRRDIEEEKKLLTQKVADVDLGEPVMQSITNFDRNLTPYDYSKEIEDEASGTFFGQCGAVIPESIEPDPAALEVWMFDMNAPTDEKRGVFITEQAANDPSIRGRIQVDNANDLVIIKPNAVLTFDTDTLRVKVDVQSVDVADDGRINKAKLRFGAWTKSGDSVPAGVPPVPPPQPLPDYNDMQFDPPPPVPGKGNMGAPLPGTNEDTYRNAPPPTTPPGGRPMSEYDDMQFDPPPVPPAPSAPPGGRPMSDYDDIEFDPPPIPPGGNQPANQPSSLNFPPGMEPPGFGATGPRPPVRDDDDDDPFGNAGDFTPLPR